MLFIKSARPCFFSEVLQLFTLSCTRPRMLFQLLINFHEFHECLRSFLFEHSNILLCIRREYYTVHRRSKNCSVVSSGFLDKPLPSLISFAPTATLLISFALDSSASDSAIILENVRLTLFDEELKCAINAPKGLIASVCSGISIVIAIINTHFYY